MKNKWHAFNQKKRPLERKFLLTTIGEKSSKKKNLHLAFHCVFMKIVNDLDMILSEIVDILYYI